MARGLLVTVGGEVAYEAHVCVPQAGAELLGLWMSSRATTTTMTTGVVARGRGRRSRSRNGGGKGRVVVVER